MSEKLKITVEELAAFLAEHDSEAGYSWQNATREQRQQFNFQARKMLAADELYKVATLANAYLQGGTVKRAAKAALALADKGEANGQ